MRQNHRWQKWLLQGVAAFVMQRVLSWWPTWLWYLSVFLTVDVVGLVLKAVTREPGQLYVDDVLWNITVFIGVGLLAFAFDHLLWTYTGRHASPAVPAIVLAMVDLDWRFGTVQTRR